MGKRTQEALAGKVRLQRLLDSLAFSDEAVASAAMDQPSLYLEAARYHVQRKRALIEAEVALSAVEAEEDIRIRRQDPDEKKKTEKYIKALVSKSRKVRKAQEKVQALEMEELWAKELKEAYRHRMNMIRTVGSLIGQEGLSAVFREKGNLEKQAARNKARQQYSEEDV